MGRAAIIGRIHLFCGVSASSGCLIYPLPVCTRSVEYAAQKQEAFSILFLFRLESKSGPSSWVHKIKDFHKTEGMANSCCSCQCFSFRRTHSRIRAVFLLVSRNCFCIKHQQLQHLHSLKNDKEHFYVITAFEVQLL